MATARFSPVLMYEIATEGMPSIVPHLQAENNAYKNPFGSEIALFRTSEGGEVGVIASVTRPFCHDCTRARVTAEGRLFTCLFAQNGHDLRSLLRSSTDDAELAAAVSRVWKAREDRYSEIRSLATDKVKAEMSLLGG